MRPGRWNAAQIAVIEEYWRKPEAEVQALVNAYGPYRSIKAIVEYRTRRLRLMKPRDDGYTAEQRLAADEARERGKAMREGWPTMSGSPEARERRYLRLLHEGLIEEHRRLAERKVA